MQFVWRDLPENTGVFSNFDTQVFSQNFHIFQAVLILYFDN